MARWIFLRHGESVANAGGFLAGWDDVPLTPLGVDQALAAGRALVSVPFERVVTSDLSRATRTAALALEARGGESPPVQVDWRLRERNLGQWSGLTLEALRADGRNATLYGWHTAPPEGESHVTLMLRVLPALIELGEAPDTLMVSHGGLLRALLGLMDGVPVEQIGRNRVPNAEAIIRDLSPGVFDRIHESLLSSAR